MELVVDLDIIHTYPAQEHTKILRKPKPHPADLGLHPIGRGLYFVDATILVRQQRGALDASSYAHHDIPSSALGHLLVNLRRCVVVQDTLELMLEVHWRCYRHSPSWHTPQLLHLRYLCLAWVFVGLQDGDCRLYHAPLFEKCIALGIQRRSH